jgi:hypothetical protein
MISVNSKKSIAPLPRAGRHGQRRRRGLARELLAPATGDDEGAEQGIDRGRDL